MNTHLRQTAPPASREGDVQIRVEIGQVIPAGVLGRLPAVTARVSRADCPIVAVEERSISFRFNDAVIVADDLTMGTVKLPSLNAALVYAISTYATGEDAEIPRRAFTVAVSGK